MFDLSDYVETLMSETLLLVTGRLKLRPEMEELQPQPALCSQFERPEKSAAVEAQAVHRRFQQT